CRLFSASLDLFCKSKIDRVCIFLVFGGYFSSNAVKNLVAVAAISDWSYSFFGPAFLTGGVSIVSVGFIVFTVLGCS
ncbi:MAG: hypothetical protein ACK6EB_44345, partial [Planctomyces sp.]